MMKNEVMTSRCDECGHGFCQGNEPCPTTQHELTRDQVILALRKAERVTESARYAAISASFMGVDRCRVAIDKWHDADRYEARLRAMLEN